jgi:hypothetical protein
MERLGPTVTRKIESRTGQYQPDAHHFHVPPWQNATNGLGLGETRCLLLFPILFASSEKRSHSIIARVKTEYDRAEESERTEPSIGQDHPHSHHTNLYLASPATQDICF